MYMQIYLLEFFNNQKYIFLVEGAYELKFRATRKQNHWKCNLLFIEVEPGSSLVVWEQVLLSANPKFESRGGRI
jgi:hypothetical protein